MRVSPHHLVQQVDNQVVIVDTETGVEYLFPVRQIRERISEMDDQWQVASVSGGGHLHIGRVDGGIDLPGNAFPALSFALGYFHGVNGG